MRVPRFHRCQPWWQNGLPKMKGLVCLLLFMLVSDRIHQILRLSITLFLSHNFISFRIASWNNYCLSCSRCYLRFLGMGMGFLYSRHSLPGVGNCLVDFCFWYAFNQQVYHRGRNTIHRIWSKNFNKTTPNSLEVITILHAILGHIGGKFWQ